MPRPVNPERHRARRLQIIDAALTVFAQHGYAGTTTAAICRAAGIGSGTFFHYFPTKDALLIAVLETGTAETAAFFAAHTNSGDPVRVILEYVDQTVADLRDPRAAGFITAVAGLTGRVEVAHALLADERAVRDGLRPWVRAAQDAGRVRTDLSDGRIADWIVLLLDGFSGQVAGRGESFDITAESAVLKDQIDWLLRRPAHIDSN